jgi:uncharacterized cupin superfamily protein
MSNIQVTRNPQPKELEERGIAGWPIWEKEVSEFPWHYDKMETCYFLEGEVTVTPEGGKPVKMGKGDLVTFPAGMSCVWTVHKPLRKHYKFE